MKPILRWAGGKRQLVPKILAAAPSQYDRYLEPFLGSAAPLLALPPHPSLVADRNAELVNFYQQLRDNHQGVLDVYGCWPNTEDFYLWLRARDREHDILAAAPVLRAARFLYLNKAGFQGLWRVNRKGQHNVPYGHPKRLAVDEEHVAAFAARLRDVDLRCCDFEELLAEARPGDFAYLDPPYVPISPTSGFVAYAGGFGTADQERLRDCCRRLDRQGTKFLQSNSDCPVVRELYAGFRIEAVQVRRSIAARGSSRGLVTEVLICNY